MTTRTKSLTTLSSVVAASLLTWWSQAEPTGGRSFAFSQLWSWMQASRLHAPLLVAPPDTTRPVPGDTVRYRTSRRPRVAPADRSGNFLTERQRRSPLILPLPANVKPQVTLGDSLDYVDVEENVGQDIDYRDPARLSYSEFQKLQEQQAIRNYFRNKAEGGVAGGPGNETAAKRLIPKIYLAPTLGRIFGGEFIDIRPNGSATIALGWRQNFNDNPSLTLRQRRNGDFNFQQNFNLNLSGQIGDKLKILFNYDTRAAFDFENQIKADFTGYDTDIIRKVEMGNVSLPLNNTLVQGGQNLFGVKTQMQFGRLSVTSVAAQLRGTADEVTVQNGAQSRNFEIKASQYEANRHFFLSQFFRDRYDAVLRNLPTVQSGVEIRRLEVYVTNDNRTTETLRNVVALQDVGEPLRTYRGRFLRPGRQSQPAYNDVNNLFDAVTTGAGATRDAQGIDGFLQNTLQLEKTVDYERVRARKLDPREYTFNPQLGYVSLNTPLLPEQVLAVSYEYFFNGKTYKVGELQDDYSNVPDDGSVFLKLLRATNPGVGRATATENPQNDRLQTNNLPVFDLMMKNIYALNASQLSRDQFRLDVIYKDDATGVDIISLKEGERVVNRPLTQVLNLDNVNPNNDRPSDGNFDFLPGLTIDPELGKIIFPVVEPFGSYLRGQFNATTEAALIQKYVFPELYVQVQSDAQQRQEKDKFYLKGRYSATATDEITLPGIRIPEGSVRVYSGATLLTEGQDYQVFYDQAKVKILNASYLNSANELRVEFERDAVVQVLPRKLLGTRLDYKVSDDLNFGGTVMHLLENQAAGINRVNVGDEPSNNTIVGLDMNLRRESRVLTKYIDALPFVNTKAPSSVAFSGEFAQFIPGKSQLGRGEDGVSYLDDFENARTPYTLGNNTTTNPWRLAATPRRIISEQQLPERSLGVSSTRARIAWYTIDQTYYTNGPSKPNNIGTEDLRNHYVRGVPRSEIFPNRDNGPLGNTYENTFDLAYYPTERGQYNYNPNVSGDGRFLNPSNPILNRNNYGGISREITFDTDFDNANVEYLEFWLMDPFINSANGVIDDSDPNTPKTANTTGGELYFNLGTISEDILSDGVYEFENGLPDTDDQNNLQNTIWGRATRLQFLTDAFSNAPGGRDRQDIGLDGLTGSDEQDFFRSIGNYGNFEDPSADNFRHHLDGFYDQNNTKILGRYKYYNGMEGNSRATSGTQSSTAFPDKEDLNRDNVINDTEQYYEYRIPLGTTGQLEVGRNFIVDKVTNRVNNDDVTWYQFRIPIRQYTGIQGAQQEFGFKSIRFLRMYMTGWSQPAVLRFVQMQFVANQWRRYLAVLPEPGAPQCFNCINDADAFAISTVGIEENGQTNGQGTAIPYVAPPGIRRDREYGSTTSVRDQNEQSLRLCVDGLKDGYAKAAYKNVSLNLLRYKRLKMFLHAESQDRNLRDGTVQGFIRFGTDYTQNYYQYTLPLVITKTTDASEDNIWPMANRVDVPLQAFVDAKARRAAEGRSLLVPYTITYQMKLDNGEIAEGKITVLGNPDLSALQGLMIGVQNPSDGGQGPDQSLCLWADELRVRDFDQTDGWAATARFNTRLADVANITATGAFTSVGFGSLQDRPSQRSLDNVARADVNAAVAAEKFLPEKLGLRVPVLLQAGAEIRSPKYDPLDPDMTLTQSLNSKFGSDQDRTAYRREVTDQTKSKSISLLNVRKERTNPDRKPKPYDIENLALSYSLTERTHTDIQTDRDFTRTYTGAVAYTYQPTPKAFEPLSKVKLFDSPYLKLLKELNFTPLPSRFAFRADLDRRYNERFLQRTQAQGQIPSTEGIPGVFQKSFFINRIYDLKWDLTRSLILDYTATNRSSVDEGTGPTIGNSQVAQDNRDLLKKNLQKGGRTTNFNQTVALTYRLPLDKFPLTDWLSADTRYSANYSWQAASTAIRAPLGGLGDTATQRVNIGNTIQNSRDINVNGRIDLVKLYNKVKFLNIINNAPAGGAKGQGAAAGQSTMDRLRRGNEAPETKGKDQGTAAADTAKGPELRVLKAVLRSLMTARSLNFTYTRTAGMLLPGYLPKTRLFGLNSDFTAPGVPFILGQQYELQDLYDLASTRGWYTQRSDLLNTPLSSLRTENLQLRTSLEPIRDFNIQVEARQQKVRNRETFYRVPVDTTTLQPTSTVVDPNTLIPLGSGSFSTTFIAVNTLFGDLRKNNTSAAFDRFVENRRLARNRLQSENPNGGLYGYNSQDVLIPAFLDAYRGKSSANVSTKKFDPFSVIPLPNWRVDYNGLSNLPLVQKYFRSVAIRHSYAADYQVLGYTTSTQYNAEPAGLAEKVNEQNQYIPYYIINQVTVSERLAPLVGVNFQTLEKINGSVDYGLDRMLALNTTNAQITELRNKTLTIGFGYTTNRFRIPFRIGGEQRILRNELNMRLDLSIRDNVTIQRSIVDVVAPTLGTPTTPGSEGAPGTATQQVTNGNRQVQLRPTIDYVINQRLNLQFFFTRNVSQPRGGTTSFKNAATEGGIQLRYSLSQ
ncbi:cell surface protein SprA [Hymenobacter sp. 15J16-1T3B]|uniref:T9SS outer membrane translocon Sov/SprA n=1 Tax=Hymenobacter sp. 15J16-1T3B TaxID=2886941 RepID=UPI001D0F6A79|nr:cell surface protein SprA [Hymenobacter sp. 15J16-1T3B]MCC3159945.1 cell surface protein SprA [Hymenobacter sp. 15J16-1T3B]